MDEKKEKSLDELEEGKGGLNGRSALVASFSSLMIYTEEAYEGFDFVFLTKNHLTDLILTDKALEDYCKITKIPLEFLLNCSRHLRQEIVREHHRKCLKVCCTFELEDNKILSITEEA